MNFNEEYSGVSLWIWGKLMKRFIYDIEGGFSLDSANAIFRTFYSLEVLMRHGEMLNELETMDGFICISEARECPPHGQLCQNKHARGEGIVRSSGYPSSSSSGVWSK